MDDVQAVEAEGLRKELKSAEASAAQTQADLAAELESQRALSEDAQHQIQALRHEVASLQVGSFRIYLNRA